MAIGSGQEEKKVRFSADDNLSPFMKKLMNDQKSLYAEFTKNAKSQTDSQKEQLKLIEQQIRALERKSRLEKEILKDQVRGLREYGGEKEQRQADILDQQIKDRRYSDKNKIGGLRDRLADDKDNLPAEKKPSIASSVFSATLLAGVVKDVLGVIAKTASAKTEYDLITPFASAAGAAGAGIAGSWTGWLSPGAPAAFTQLGKEAGGFVGAGYTRHLMAREDALSSLYKVQGLTGERGVAGNLSSLGIDRAGGSKLEESIVRAIAKGTTAQQIRNVAAISKAYSVETGVLTNFLSMGRMGSIVNEGQFIGLKERGIDRNQRGTALQNVTQLLQVMGQGSLAPSAAEALQKIEESNRIGGAYSVADPRSIGYQTTIQNNLSNPQDALSQALSYQVLREQNPNASYIDLLKKRQAGGSTYERGVLEKISGLTSNQGFNSLFYSNHFGTGNIAVDESRLAGRSNIASGGSAITSVMNKSQEDALYKEGGSLTTSLQKSTAEVQNAFVIGFTDGISKLASNFTDKMTEATDKWVKEHLIPILNHVDSQKSKVPNKNGNLKY